VSIKTLSYLALAETISWTLLLISVVAKYGFDKPQGVKVMGPIHGVLFIGVVLVLLSLHMSQKWSFNRTAKIFLSTFVPIGGYFLISHEAEAAPVAAA
jgi:integral membrane protein